MYNRALGGFLSRFRSIALTQGVAALVLCLGLGTAARAEHPADRDTDCDCGLYLHLVTFRSLADEVAAIGIKQVNTAGAAFSTSEMITYKKVLAAAGKLIPEHCREKILRNVTPGQMRVVARYSTDAGFGEYVQSGARSLDLLSTHESVTSAFMDFGGCRGQDQCIRERRQKGFEEASAAASSPDFEAQVAARAKARRMSNPLKGMSSSEIKLLSVWSQYIAKTSVADREAYLRTLTGLRFEDKITIATMFGRRGYQGYDTRMAKEGIGGGLPAGQIDDAIRANTISGAYVTGGRDPVRDELVLAGICRHLAPRQAEMLGLMGVKHSYSVAFDTFTGSGHMTVIAQEDGSKEVYVLDGGSASNRASGSGKAMFQGRFDAGQEYRVFDYRGRPVALRDSEWGKFVKESMGMDLRTVDPLARSNSSMLGADYTVDKGGHFQVRLVVGKDGAGGDNRGVAATTSWFQENGLFPGRVGVYAGYMTRSLEGPGGLTARGEPVAPLTMGLVSGVIQQGVQTPYVEITPKLQARIEAEAQVLLSKTYTVRGGEFEGTNYNGASIASSQHRGNVGIRVKQGESLKDRLSAEYYAGIQGFVAAAGAQYNWGEKYALVLNHMVFSAEGRLMLAKTEAGRAYLVAATTVVADAFGFRAKSEGGLAMPSGAATAFVQGRLRDEDASFVDGGGREVGGSLTYRAAPWLELTGQGTVGMERGGAPNLPFSFTGNVILSR